MNETSAIEVTLLQAFETAQPASPNWSTDDSAWATRLASAQDSSRSDERFIAQRAHHAMQRLLPRERGAAKWVSARVSIWPWALVIVAVALLLGLLADSIGSAQRINLLAPPLWAVVLWNAAVYLLLLGQWLRGWFESERKVGALTRWMQKLMQWSRSAPGSVASGSTPALQAFAAEWMRRSAPLSLTRATVLMHVGSAALALGLIVGMYLRGLVLDYRASWESTFLSAESAHAALSFLLSPASQVAHIALPNLAAFDALRSTHLSPSSSGATGATWIHLYAVTLALFVVLPRIALTLWSAWRARWMASRFKLPLSDEYFARLLRQHQGRQAAVVAMPYAYRPNEAATAGLRTVLATTMGPEIKLNLAPTLAYGAEDESTPKLPLGTTLTLALFDLSATPEAETQGRFAQHLAATASTVVVIDEAGFQRRFAQAPERLEQRRDAWRAWAKALGTEPVFLNLQQPELKNAERDVLAAMKAPVRKLQP
jgi:Protein of unknown function (DUF2868)